MQGFPSKLFGCLLFSFSCLKETGSGFALHEGHETSEHIEFNLCKYIQQYSAHLIAENQPLLPLKLLQHIRGSFVDNSSRYEGKANGAKESERFLGIGMFHAHKAI